MQNKTFSASRNSARKRHQLLMITMIAISCILCSGVGIAVYCRHEAAALEHVLLEQEKQNISLQQELSATGECEKLQQLIRYDREFIARIEQKKSLNFTNIAIACSQTIPDSIILTKLYCCAKKIEFYGVTKSPEIMCNWLPIVQEKIEDYNLHIHSIANQNVEGYQFVIIGEAHND